MIIKMTVVVIASFAAACEIVAYGKVVLKLYFQFLLSIAEFIYLKSFCLVKLYLVDRLFLSPVMCCKCLVDR